jgi:deoxyadenosine/deoxycytidine kinase
VWYNTRMNKKTKVIVNLHFKVYLDIPERGTTLTDEEIIEKVHFFADEMDYQFTSNTEANITYTELYETDVLETYPSKE